MVVGILLKSESTVLAGVGLAGVGSDIYLGVSGVNGSTTL
jgi:hypothetical protein